MTMAYTKFTSLKTPSYMGKSAYAGKAGQEEKNQQFLPARERTQSPLRSKEARFSPLSSPAGTALKNPAARQTSAASGTASVKSGAKQNAGTVFGKAAMKTGTAFDKQPAEQTGTVFGKATVEQTGTSAAKKTGYASGRSAGRPEGTASGASSGISSQEKSRQGMEKVAGQGSEKPRFSASKVCVFSLLTLAVFTSAVYSSGLCAPEHFTRAFLAYCEKAGQAETRLRAKAKGIGSAEADAFGESLYVQGLGNAGTEGTSGSAARDADFAGSGKGFESGGSYAGSLLTGSGASGAAKTGTPGSGMTTVLAASAYTDGAGDPSAVFPAYTSEADAVFSSDSPPPAYDEGDIVCRDLSRGGDGIYLLNETGRDIDVEALSASPLPEALRLYGTEEPEVLILHTHGTESYIDTGSRSTDTEKNVVRVGDELAKVLEAYGISVLHSRTMHDEYSYITAYKSSKTEAQKLLASYPSVKYVIDLHRDALPKDGGARIKCVSDIHGTAAAQMMLVIGSDAGGGNHPNYTENLAAASRLQAEMNREFPTLMRPINLRSAVFNQDICRGAMILEVGCSDNTLEEALCAVRCFAKAFVRTGQGA